MSTRDQRRAVFKEEGGRQIGPGGRPFVELRCQCGRLIGRFASLKACRGFYGRCHRCKASIIAGIARVEKDP